MKEAMKLKSVNSSCTVMMHRKYLEEDIEGPVAVVFAAAASDGSRAPEPRRESDGPYGEDRRQVEADPCEYHPRGLEDGVRERLVGRCDSVPEDG